MLADLPELRKGHEYGWHWLKSDLTAGSGDEIAWTVGEERSITGRIKICERGYHFSPSPWDALEYIAGPVLTLIEAEGIGKGANRHADKAVCRTRKLLAAVNVERELRQFAIDCAIRALERERTAGREPDARSWAAIAAATDFLAGRIDSDGLDAARDAAWDAARAAAWDAERGWQRQRFEELLAPRIVELMARQELI